MFRSDKKDHEDFHIVGYFRDNDGSPDPSVELSSARAKASSRPPIYIELRCRVLRCIGAVVVQVGPFVEPCLAITQ